MSRRDCLADACPHWKRGYWTLWKKAFVVLLCLNLLVVGSTALWILSFPKTTPLPSAAKPVVPPIGSATVQLSVGQSAINTYLEYFVADQAEMRRVLSYARVQFSDVWDLRLGVKLAQRVIPADVQIVPVVSAGNLALNVQHASLGDVPVPTSLLFVVFQQLAWPTWITVDGQHDALDINFSRRPQTPYGMRVLNYSDQTRLLTMLVTMLPRSLPTG